MLKLELDQHILRNPWNNLKKDEQIDRAYHAPVANTDLGSIVLSSESNPALSTLVTEDVTTIPAVMLQ